MSFIPARKMPHITAGAGEFDAESGKIIHLATDKGTETGEASDTHRLRWIAGAAGVSLAAAAGIAALFTLRSSSGKAPSRRHTTAKRRRATTAKHNKAA